MHLSYLSYLPSFAKVVERKNFSAAARDLGMTKSAISKHITALEEQLNVRLLNRTTRTISLTEEGRLFWQTCQQVLDELRLAEQQMQHVHTNPSGVLRLNAPHSFGELHLAPLIARFAAKYPDIKLEVDFTDQFIDVVQSGVDVCIRIASLTDSRLIARKLAPCRIILAASPAYLKKWGRPEHPDDLINHRFIEYAHVEKLREWRYKDPQDGKEKMVPTQIVMRANSGQMLKQAALAGVGLVHVPSFLISEEIKKGHLIALLQAFPTAPERNIYALFPDNRFMASKLRLFVDFIAEHFTGIPEWDK